jgi:hypothetical protein
LNEELVHVRVTREIGAIDALLLIKDRLIVLVEVRQASRVTTDLVTAGILFSRRGLIGVLASLIDEAVTVLVTAVTDVLCLGADVPLTATGAQRRVLVTGLGAAAALAHIDATLYRGPTYGAVEPLIDGAVTVIIIARELLSGGVNSVVAVITVTATLDVWATVRSRAARGHTRLSRGHWVTAPVAVTVDVLVIGHRDPLIDEAIAVVVEVITDLSGGLRR